MLTLQECYEILGVQPQDSFQNIRKAYLVLVKRWHPDHHAQNPNEAAKAEEKFHQIQTAYEQIKQHHNPAQSPPFSSSPPPPKTTVRKVGHAEDFYHNAVLLGQVGDYKEAIAELSAAIRINPSYAIAYRYRGHLNSLLGLEYQAQADLRKADLLEAAGPYAQTVHLSQDFRRSPVTPKPRKGKISTPRPVYWFRLSAMVAVAIAVITAWTSLSSDSPTAPQNPLEIDAQASVKSFHPAFRHKA